MTNINQPPRTPTAELLGPWFDLSSNPFDMNPSKVPSSMVQTAAKTAASGIPASIDLLKGSKGHLVYPIKDFVNEIFGLKRRSEERIVELHRRKEQTSVGHEFIIVTMKTAQNSNAYLRLDRRPAPSSHRSGLFLVSSKVPASDSVSAFTFYFGATS